MSTTMNTSSFQAIQLVEEGRPLAARFTYSKNPMLAADANGLLKGNSRSLALAVRGNEAGVRRSYDVPREVEYVRLADAGHAYGSATYVVELRKGGEVVRRSTQVTSVLVITRDDGAWFFEVSTVSGTKYLLQTTLGVK